MRSEEAAVAGHELQSAGRAPIDRLLRPSGIPGIIDGCRVFRIPRVLIPVMF